MNNRIHTPDERWFQSGRLLLRSTSIKDVVEYAETDEWELASDTPENPKEGAPRELRWLVTDQLAVHCINDPVTADWYLVVTGRDPQAIQSLAAQLEKEMDIWQIEHLTADSNTKRDPHELALATLRLGLAAPHSFEEPIFDCIKRATRHPEQGVRHAALLAASHTAWPEFLPLLAAFIDREEDFELAEAAQAVVDAFKETGITRQ